MLDWLPAKLIVTKPIAELKAPAVLFSTTGKPEILKICRGEEGWMIYLDDEFAGQGYPIPEDNPRAVPAIENLEFEVHFPAMLDPNVTPIGNLWLWCKQGVLGIQHVNAGTTFKDEMVTPIGLDQATNERMKPFAFPKWRLVLHANGEKVVVFSFDGTKNSGV